MAHDELLRDWKVLCEKIGERRAGTANERRAADYIAAQWTAAGLSDVRLESFPCTSMTELRAEVHEPLGNTRWKQVEAVPLVGTPPTAGSGAVEGDLVWLELPEGGHRLRPRSPRGKILALF